MTVVAILAACALAIHFGPWAVEFYGRGDPKPVVIDEFAGQWIAVLALPAVADAGLGGLAAVLFGQFLLFRIFDILKPPPARQFERLRDGWGILCDDLMAGVYANLAGQLVWRFTPLAHWLGLAQ